MEDSVLKTRCQRIEISLEEARTRGGLLDEGDPLPETAEELERAKSNLDIAPEDSVPYGLVAVWTMNPLRVNLYWRRLSEFD